MIRTQHASIFATCPLQKLNYQSPDRCTGTVLFICEALKISTGKDLIQVCYKLNKQLNSHDKSLLLTSWTSKEQKIKLQTLNDEDDDDFVFVFFKFTFDDEPVCMYLHLD